MGRKPTKCAKKCKNHIFLLKPMHYSAHFSREVEVSFCPPSLKHHPIHPVFNRDHKHYTSSFILKEDEVKYQMNDALYRNEHDKFCKEQLTGKSLMLKPKPRSKLQYCHVCKNQYQDYSDHMHSPEHKEKIKLNKFSAYIDELIAKNYPSRLSAPEPDLNSALYEDSLGLDKESFPTTISLPSHPSNPPNENLFQSPFKSMQGKGAFQPHHLPNKTDILKKTIIIQQEESGKKFEFQQIVLKRISTYPTDQPKRMPDSPRVNPTIILNNHHYPLAS